MYEAMHMGMTINQDFLETQDDHEIEDMGKEMVKVRWMIITMMVSPSRANLVS
jgi:hypothetical protein